MDRTGHPVFWVPSPHKKMAPNKASHTVNNKGKHVKLSLAFARDPEKRIKIQRISVEEQFGKSASKPE